MYLKSCCPTALKKINEKILSYFCITKIKNLIWTTKNCSTLTKKGIVSISSK